MSSLFDAPVQLVIMLAAIVAGHEPAELAPTGGQIPVVAEQGPFAFSEAVWLGALRLGYGGADAAPYRGRIFATTGGRIYVPVIAEKREILAARRSGPVARAVAVDLARFHAGELRQRLGRAPNVKDLYAAHMMGLDIAARLAGLSTATPKALVASAVPEIAATFPQLVTRRGARVTVADFYGRLPGSADPILLVTENVPLAPASAPVPEAPISTIPKSQFQVSRTLPVGLDDYRAAPLRGLIEEANVAAIHAAQPARGEHLAKLGWTTVVYRAQ